MRPALIAGLVLVVTPAAGFPQSGPYLATVTDPEVKLRAGPSDKFPETATLNKGSVVLVEPPGGSPAVFLPGPESWLVPRPGSPGSCRPTPPGA